MYRKQADPKANTRIIAKQMFRLLPAQVFLMAIGSVNGLVSIYFADNHIGMEAMSAVGLYFPVVLFINALSIMMVGGSTILCGRYMGIRMVFDIAESVQYQNLLGLNTLTIRV